MTTGVYERTSFHKRILLENLMTNNKRRLGMSNTEESKKKVSKSLKLFYKTKAGKIKLEQMKQRTFHHSEETKCKISKKHLGKILSEEHKSKLSLAHGGTGTPRELTEYGSEFDDNLKEQVRFRDKYLCRKCGCSQLENGKQLDVHHIDYDKMHNLLNNLISLCMSCHRATNVTKQKRKKLTTFFRKMVNNV